ncbi:MAG: ATP-dependent DNA ligase [Acidobacteriaceae bacterium]
MNHNTDFSRFQKFAELCQRLAETSGKLEKRALMAEYLRSLPVPEAGLSALYLAGSPFSETDGRELNVGGALLSRTLANLSGASQPAMHAAYRRHGDLGGAACELLEARSFSPTLRLAEVAQAFAEIAAAQKPAAKQQITQRLLEAATPLEAKYLIKIILGDMRTGIKVSLVEEAIAAAWGAPIGEVRNARMLNGNLLEVVELAATGRLAEARMKLFHPLGFMLASPVETVDEALQRFSVEVVEEGQTGPAIKEAQLEDKYDGIRAQIHCGSTEHPGRVALFSRSRDDMTVSFPELVEAFAGFEEPLILDGEILAWNPKAERALPFSSLQARVGRKRVTNEMRAAVPVVFMAFDLLYTGREMMMEKPLVARRQALEQLVQRERDRTRVGGVSTAAGQQGELQFATVTATDVFPRMVLAPAVQLESVAQLEQAYVDARARGNEGVMLKARHSLYQPGRRGLAWLKLKRELATLDVVVTAAEYGHGKRAGWLSDYTFAVRDGDALRNVGKAYSGVTDLEIATLTRFFIEHTLEDYGGLRTVQPLVVFEVAFNNVMRSDRHDSGYALRFPRILRIRDDKPVSEIDTLARVAEIYQSQPDKPVEVFENNEEII